MRRCDVLRVFTRGDAGGNHLGVVTDLTGLDGEAMQQVAAELGYSETIFLDVDAEPVPEVRIFTPAAELPFAGHPLVGAAWVLGGADASMRCGIGEVRATAGPERAAVEVPLSLRVEEAADGVEMAAAAGLPEPRGAWWARMPIPYLVLEYDSPDVVAAARPDPRALAAGRAGEAAYLIAGAGPGRAKARFFAPGLGVFEDPATGSAAAAWAAVSAFRGIPSGEVRIAQGDEIGHPSTIELAWSEGICRLGGTVRRDGSREVAR